MRPESKRWISASSVRIKVVYFAQARESAGAKVDEFALNSPASLEQLFAEVIAAHPGLIKLRQSLYFILNGIEGTESAVAKAVLNDGDEVAILVPVVGG